MKRSAHSGLTLSHIAKLAGVAPITVSRVLNQPQQVKPATLEKVRKVIEETGFVRNQLAGALASNRSRLVAVIVPMLTNTIFSDTFQAIASQLAAANYQVLLGTSGYEAKHEQELLEVILSRRPDGVILTGTLHTEASRRRLKAARVPVVETWDISPDPIDMLVGFSHREVGSAIALHLLAKNYRHFALIGVDDPRGSLRARTFTDTLAAQGISDIQQQMFCGAPTLQQGREGLSNLLEDATYPLMVVCTSDTIAHGVLTEALSRGLRVPEEIAVFGFGDMNFAAHTFPTLSTVRIDGQRIGELAARALLARLKEERAEPLYQDIGFTIIDRDSTQAG